MAVSHANDDFWLSILEPDSMSRRLSPDHNSVHFGYVHFLYHAGMEFLPGAKIAKMSKQPMAIVKANLHHFHLVGGFNASEKY